MPAPLISPVPVPTRRFRPRGAAAAGGVAGVTPSAAELAGSGTTGDLALVPRITDKSVLEPVRRFSERVEDPLNALMRAGILVRTGPARWTISVAATGAGTGVTADGRTPGHYEV